MLSLRSVEKDVKYWVNLARYDIETAESMYKSRRYLYVLFTCEQAAEKMLKAAVVKTTEKFPPKTHDLVRLASMAKVDFGPGEEEFLGKLSFYYIQSRYPQETLDVPKDTAKECLERTREIVKWLEQKLH